VRSYDLIPLQHWNYSSDTENIYFAFSLKSGITLSRIASKTETSCLPKDRLNRRLFDTGLPTSSMVHIMYIVLISIQFQCSKIFLPNATFICFLLLVMVDFSYSTEILEVRCKILPVARIYSLQETP